MCAWWVRCAAARRARARGAPRSDPRPRGTAACREGEQCDSIGRNTGERERREGAPVELAGGPIRHGNSCLGSCFMRAIIQRVLSSSVVVEGETIASIGKGLCVLVGITQGDGEPEIEHIVRKVLNMKLWPDPDTDKPWQRSVMTMGYGEIVVPPSAAAPALIRRVVDILGLARLRLTQRPRRCAVRLAVHSLRADAQGSSA
eukprot:COSAG01_NODE_425_length_17240_cov_29.899306_8_plen_202_part_00